MTPAEFASLIVLFAVPPGLFLAFTRERRR